MGLLEIIKACTTAIIIGIDKHKFNFNLVTYNKAINIIS